MCLGPGLTFWHDLGNRKDKKIGTWKYNESVPLLFIDFKNANDSFRKDVCIIF